MSNFNTHTKASVNFQSGETLIPEIPKLYRSVTTGDQAELRRLAHMYIPDTQNPFAALSSAEDDCDSDSDESFLSVPDEHGAPRTQQERRVKRALRTLESNKLWWAEAQLGLCDVAVHTPQGEHIQTLTLSPGSSADKVFDSLLSKYPSLTGVAVGQKIFRKALDDFELWVAHAIEFRIIQLVFGLLGGVKIQMDGVTLKANRPKKHRRPKATSTAVVVRAVKKGRKPMRLGRIPRGIANPTARYLWQLQNPFHENACGILGPGCMPNSVPKHYHIRGKIASVGANSANPVLFYPHPSFASYAAAAAWTVTSPSLTAYTSTPSINYHEQLSSIAADYTSYKVEACGIRFRSLLPSNTAPATVDMMTTPTSDRLTICAGILESTGYSSAGVLAGKAAGASASSTTNILQSRNAINFTTTDVYERALEVALFPTCPRAFEYQSCVSNTGYDDSVGGANVVFDEGVSSYVIATGQATNSFVTYPFRLAGWEALTLGFNNTGASTNILEFEMILHISGIPNVSSTAYPGSASAMVNNYIGGDEALHGARGMSNWKVLGNGIISAGNALVGAARSPAGQSIIRAGVNAFANYRQGYPMLTNINR